MGRKTMKLLNKNEELCVGCRMCELSCAFNKTNRFTPAKSRIWIKRDEENGIFDPIICRHCAKPPCEKACPIEGEKPIYRDKKSGIVRLKSDKGCIGCYECVRACPFGSIRIDPEDGDVFKCDLCNGDPECVTWCPTGAIQFLEKSTINISKVMRKTT